MIVRTIELDKISGKNLKYVVVCVRSKGKWLFARQKRRNSWDIPGGHIEFGEKVLSAAKRELFEETGLKREYLIPICDYYAEESLTDYAYGRLYFCETNDFQNPPKEFEMAETRLFDNIPENLTHKEIHKILYLRALQFADCEL